MFQQTPHNRVLFPPCLKAVLRGVALLFRAFAYYPCKTVATSLALLTTAVLVAALFATSLTPRPATAATQSTINFQARLQSNTGALVPDGFYNIQFKLYDAASAGTNLWTETYYDANGVTAGQDNRVQVKNGYLSVALGSQTAFPGTINWDQQLYLTMNIGGVTQTATPTYDGEMSPRLALAAVPYAFRAGQLATTNGSYTSTLGINAPTGGSQTFQIPDQGAAGTYTLLTQNTANTNYIQNTTSPQTANFNITGNGTVGGALTAAGNITTTGGALAVQGSADSYFTGGLALGTTTSPTAKLTIQTGTGYGLLHTNGTTAIGTYIDSTAGWFGTKSNHPLYFFTNDGSRTLSLLVNGNLGVGTNYTPNYKLDVDGDINTGANLRTGSAIRLDASGNLSNIGTYNGSGNITSTGGVLSMQGSGTNSLTGNLTVGGTFAVTGQSDLTASLALKKGADFSTTGTTNNAAFADASLIRLTGASAQTITGIAGGRDGRFLTVVNAASQAATITNNDAGSTATNRIITGTGASISLAAGASIQLIYDSTAGFWRVAGAAAGSSGSAVTSVGAIDSQTKSANGAVISGTSIYLQTADGTNPGLVSTGTQTFAGAKTFSNQLTTSGGITNNNAGIANVGAIAGATTINGSGNVTIQAAGTNTLLLDTVGAGTVTVGQNATTLNLGTGTSTETVNVGASTGNDTVNIATAGGTDVVNIGKSTTNTTTTNIYGNTTIKTPGTNSSTAFQVQNAAGSAVMSVDTTLGKVQTSNLDALPVSAGAAGAITRTARLDDTTPGLIHYGTGSYTPSTSFTPNANTVLVANVYAGESSQAAAMATDGSDLVISGGGLTWVPITGAARAVNTTSDVAIRSFYAVVGSTPPANMRVTVGSGGIDIFAYEIHVSEFNHVNMSSPVAGAVSATTNGTVDNQTFTLTLGSAPSTGDVAIGVVSVQAQNAGNFGNNGLATPAGWTTYAQTGTTSPYYSISSQLNGRTGSTSTTVNFAMGNLNAPPQDIAYSGFILKQETSSGSGSNLTLGGSVADNVVVQSNSGFQVQNSSGTSLFGVDGASGIVSAASSLQVAGAFFATNTGPTLQAAKSDDFTSSTLNVSQWIHQGGAGGSYSLTANPGHLRLSVTAGARDCFGATNSCTYMYENTSLVGDRQFITKIDTGTFQGKTYSGIMLRQDTTNFIRFDVINDTTASCAWRINVDITRASATTGGNVMTSACSATAPASTWLRIDKVGTAYTYYYSTNGTTWVPVTGSTATSTQLLGWLDLTNAGLVVGAYGSTVTQNTDFDYFYMNSNPAAVTVGSGGLVIVSDSPQALNIQGTSGGSALHFDSVNAVLQVQGRICVGYNATTSIEPCVNSSLGVYGSANATGGFATNANPDIAEKISVADGVEAGDVVMADPSAKERAVKSSGVKASAIGVISDGTSGFMINRSQYDNESSSNDTDTKPLVLAGRVPVKVTNENGPITPGDSLMASSTPGYAMKAKGSGETIGKALEAFNGTDGKVLALINLSYSSDDSSGESLAEQVGNLQDQVTAMGANINVTNLKVKNLTVTGNAAVAGDLTVHGVAKLSGLELSGHFVTKGDKPTLQLQAAAGSTTGAGGLKPAEATITGNDTAGQISIFIGDDPNANTLLKVIFNTAYDRAPQILITPVGKGSAGIQAYVDATTKNDFMLGAGLTPQSQQTYIFNYQVVQADMD